MKILCRLGWHRWLPIDMWHLEKKDSLNWYRLYFCKNCGKYKAFKAFHGTEEELNAAKKEEGIK